MNRVSFSHLFILLFVLSTSFISCAVFEVIGDSLAQFYDNSVSYFNAYYNAKRIFDEAEETVINAELAARGKTNPDQRSMQLPATARDKFNGVIDKCSSILSFYPKSTLVDDALLLIGKSYYYLQDYLKAERKFSELVAQYPQSSLVPESQLWLARTLQKQHKEEDAKKVASQVAAAAIEQKEPAIASEAYALLGLLAEQESNAQSAIDFYTKAVAIAQDDFSTATLHAKLGDLYLSLKDYEKSVSAYIKVYDRVSDLYLNYYSRIQAARGYTVLKRYDTAIFLTNEMLNDFRYAEFHPTIRLEYANILLASGRTAEALDEYQFLDSTYARTEAGSNASYALAQYYEMRKGDYSRARLYYSKASASSGSYIAQQARKRENALARVITLKRQLFLDDSLVVLSDSLRKYPEKFSEPDRGQQKTDSLATATDSLDAKPKQPRVVFQPVNPDSMRTIQARIAYDLGDVFYTGIEIPDSALTWFQKALDWMVDSTRAPRAMFILAELSKTTATRTDTEITELYRKIINDFPNSTYADEARKVLGLPVARRNTEQGEGAYALAESLLWAGKYAAAIERLKAIVQENPSTPLAAKSQYAIGWTYENYLSNADSALINYKLLVEQYKSSPYAAAVKNRISEASTSNKKEQAPASQPQEQQNAKTKPELDDEPLKMRTQKANESKADTVKKKIKE